MSTKLLENAEGQTRCVEDSNFKLRYTWKVFGLRKSYWSMLERGEAGGVMVRNSGSHKSCAGTT